MIEEMRCAEGYDCPEGPDGACCGNPRLETYATRQAPKVKALEWVDYPINGEPVISMAVTALGTYFICDDVDDFSGLYCNFETHKDATWYGTVKADRQRIVRFEHDHVTIQAAAQADYDRRILSALEE